METNDLTADDLATIKTYLRPDRSLSPKSCEAIESVLRAAVEHLDEIAAEDELRRVARDDRYSNEYVGILYRATLSRTRTGMRATL